MDPKNAIEIRNISKTYKVKVGNTQEKTGLFSKSTRIIKNKVIDDISLDIRKGDVLGIVGRNGSGKSTFLSLLARIMEPDSGTIERSGKIASILELGMGFHGDMSGRENIYLKGELYGFSKKELDRRIDHIIEYSGIGKYIDSPVRTYSSGMTGRLAFAIMVNVDSEIMLVDEVLSVGDAAFESKAREHFKQVAASGKTVVFVSHQMSSLEKMCNRAIWIEGGKIVKDGPVKEVCAEYQTMLNESPTIVAELADAGVADSQYKLALMYRDGKKMPANEELYREFVKKAAIQGHTKAQIEYGNIFLKDGDVLSATSFYRLAADKGDNEARMKMSSLNTSDKEEINQLLNFYKTIAVRGDAINEYRYADLLLKTSTDENGISQAFEMFVNSSEDGYPNSMHQLGIMYRDGIGTPRDIKKMEEYFIKASELGFIPSITLLSDIYMQGNILQRDENKAFEWTLKASKLGHAPSMYRLAMMYRDGVGTKADIAESEKWFNNYAQSNFMWYRIYAYDYIGMYADNNIEELTKINKKLNGYINPISIGRSISFNAANNIDNRENFELMKYLANNGDVDAMKRLGNIYYDGFGVDIDYSEAIKWYEKAANMGDNWCKLRLGEMYRDGKGHEKDIQTSVMYYQKAASQGSPKAAFDLIKLCVGDKIKDRAVYDNAKKLLVSISNNGNIDGMKRLGDIYYDGIGVEVDCSEAIKWYEKAANMGDIWCKVRLGEMYRDGKGHEKDIQTSVMYFQKAALQGSPEAAFDLITLCSNGAVQNEQTYNRAMDLLLVMANSGDVNAMRYLSDIFHEGIGVKPDLTEAIKWYEKAANMGDKWASLQLEKIVRNNAQDTSQQYNN